MNYFNPAFSWYESLFGPTDLQKTLSAFPIVLQGSGANAFTPMGGLDNTWIQGRRASRVRQLKQELRGRMHDPVPQTGKWLKSVVQGYFNYYAVPGNLDSLSVFRHRALVFWWHSIRRRSQKRRINWTRMLVLAKRWLPPPQTLHPFPDTRFAASHPR